MEWNLLLAGFINTTATLLLVQGFKTYVLPAVPPALLPVLAGALGPLVALAQTALGQALGYPVDLSPLAGLVTGLSATAVNQVVKQSTAPTTRLHKLIG